MMIKFIFAGLMLFSAATYGQQQNKEDAKTAANLKQHINYLADDKLEGRRTGTAGEKLAYEYIEQQLKNAGLQPFGADKNYIQSFTVNEGREIKSTTFLKTGEKNYKLNEEYFPLAYSGKSIKLTNNIIDISVIEIKKIADSNAGNPHFDLYDALLTKAKQEEANGRSAVFFSGTDADKNDIKFEPKDRTVSLGIPVIYIKNNADFLRDNDKNPLSLNVDIAEKEKTGHNIISYINNNAANTIILGAHYDHLGYGEDHNSLYNGTTPMIHNGADDNASGTAALIETGRWLKKSGYKKYNYLLINFSGEELGLFGSKYFTEHAGMDLTTVNYMINMDMIGRLNDSTHGLTIGGYGTSPAWGNIINPKDNFFKLNLDSAGSGPSDHTSFYRKDIPVLFFFTGSHKDYHKPSDDADKINYAGEMQVIRYIKNIIAQTDKMDKLPFTKTREATAGRSSFKVSLGIMPDYTFSGSGVLVDGVSDNKAAQKAGIKTGDILVQLGDHKFNDVQTYMDALNKFNKGESTKVKLLRGKEEMEFVVMF
jgi:aminopeptidase YwaD